MREIPLLTVAEVFKVKQPKYRIEQWLLEDTLAVIFGISQSFKSFVAVDWGLSVASGIPWLGNYETKAGPVVYIAAEGHVGLLKKRMGAWFKSHDREERKYEVPFFTVPTNLDLVGTDAERLIERIRKIVPSEPAMIIVDTLARNFSGKDENSTQDMGQFVDVCDKLRKAFPQGKPVVLIVHHTGWAKIDSNGRSKIQLGHAATVPFTRALTPNL